MIFNATRPLATGGVYRYGRDLEELLSSSNIEVVTIIGKSEGNLMARLIGVTRDFLRSFYKSDVIHFITLSPFNLPFMIAAKALRKKLVVTYHGNYRKEISISNRPLLFILYAAADNITRMVTTTIVFPTKHLADMMNSDKKRKVTVIPNPVRSTPKQYALVPEGIRTNLKDEIVLVTASNFNILRKCRPIELLLEATKILANDYPLKLFIFGSGTYLAEFSEKGADLLDVIVFMGFREEFLKYVSIADAYVHLSGLDNQPYSVIDALRMGKVVLCNDVGGVLENLRPEDNYIVELSLDSVIAGLQRMLSDLLYDKIRFLEKGEMNREYLFDMHGREKVAQKYIDLYSHLT